MQHALAPRHLVRLRLFAVSLWLSLALTLVSAMAPTGAPMSRAFGSAFDPATTLVALGENSSDVAMTDDYGSADRQRSRIVQHDVLPAAKLVLPSRIATSTTASLAEASFILYPLDRGVPPVRGPPLA